MTERLTDAEIDWLCLGLLAPFFWTRGPVVTDGDEVLSSDPFIAVRVICQLRDDLSTMTAEIAALRADNASLAASLADIAKQKRTDELETAADVEYADFEGGYDACIDVARAAIEPKP